MRKPSQTTNTGRSKVRIFFVDADLAPGDMQELTHALTSAVRPTHTLTRVAPAPRLAPAADGNGVGDHDAEVEIADAEESEVVDQPTSDGSATKAPPRKRSYRKPKPVDMDMSAGGKPFKEFAAEKGPTVHRTKYLVAAAWLHDYAKFETIKADHVFTCYKAAGWNFDIGDPTVTFRTLKSEGFGTLKHGSFSINHLGLAEVVDMKATA